MLHFTKQELARRRCTLAADETTRAVTAAIARWLAESATSDETVRNAMETIYLPSRLPR